MQRTCPVVRTLVATTCLLLPALGAAGSRTPVTIPERFAGADRVIVARIAAAEPRLERNEWGDELIVTHATLAVEETLKGRGERQVVVAVEGGTLGDLTLHVSDLPSIAAGDRAVFFLRQRGPGRTEPHLRGLGILLLDAEDRVRGSSLTLNTIRGMAPASPGAR